MAALFFMRSCRNHEVRELKIGLHFFFMQASPPLRDEDASSRSSGAEHARCPPDGGQRRMKEKPGWSWFRNFRVATLAVSEKSEVIRMEGKVGLDAHACHRPFRRRNSPLSVPAIRRPSLRAKAFAVACGNAISHYRSTQRCAAIFPVGGMKHSQDDPMRPLRSRSYGTTSSEK